MIKNPIILVDGSFYIHKVYYAFPPLKTSYGKPTWVIYGFIKILKSLIIRYHPIHVAVIFDAPGRTFRDDLFKQYKSNRIKMPENLFNQIDSLYKIIYAMGVPILQIPYVEADDVIATLAVFYAKIGQIVLISTGDKDMAQIVSEKIHLIDTLSANILSSEEIKKKFGVPPNLIADYLALTGDRSDNIPGVPGIGSKTAQILLNKIGNLQKLYANLDKILSLKIRGAQTVLNALISHQDLALLSLRLSSIKIDVPLKKEDYILSVPQINIKELIRLFKKYEFNHWLSQLKLNIWLEKYNFYTNITSRSKQE